MKLVRMSCPNCGGTLEVSDASKQVKCPFCNSVIAVDDEVRHVQFDNTEKAGYDFEQGRMRAQQEAVSARIAEEQTRVQAQQDAERKKKNLKWWILGWIFVFPIPLTVLIVRSKKIKPLWKTIMIIAIWGAFLLLGLLPGKNDRQNIDTPVTTQEYVGDESPQSYK